MSILAKYNKAMESKDEAALRDIIHDDYTFTMHKSGTVLKKDDVVKWAMSGDINRDKVRESLEDLGFESKENIEHLHSIRTVLAEYGENVHNILKIKMGENLKFIKTEDLGESLGVYCKKYQKKFKEKNILLS